MKLHKQQEREEEDQPVSSLTRRCKPGCKPTLELECTPDRVFLEDRVVSIRVRNRFGVTTRVCPGDLALYNVVLSPLEEKTYETEHADGCLDVVCSPMHGIGL
jgi:hypothetical protein